MQRSTIEPQQERSADTRRRVLDAAIESLTSAGYAATTTTAVGVRAGVSRGALLYHFPTRQQLMSAAVAHLFDDMRSQYQQAFTKLPRRGDRLSAAIDLLWNTFQDDRLTAVLDLWLAARTDPELRAQLLPVSEAHHRHILELAGKFFPESQQNQRFESILNLLIDTLQGAAVRKLGRPKDPSLRPTIALIKEFAAAAIRSVTEEQP